jgi:pilus assembly protein CpaF
MSAADDAAELRERLLRTRRAPAFDRVVEREEPRGERRARASSDLDRVQIRARLQQRLFDRLTDTGEMREGPALREEVERFVEDVLSAEELALNADERARLADELTEEALGMGPLAPLMADPAVTDILVNGPEQVFVERYGRLEPTDVRFQSEEHVRRLIERLASRMGRRVDQASPMVDLRLPDGSRVNATLPPVSIDGPTLSIRRFGLQRLRAVELQERGMFSPEMRELLRLAVVERQSILISGGTGAGKSTLLGALAEAIQGDDRIVTIEDTAELQLDQRHVVRLETRPPNVEGQGRITTRDLLVNALRMRPTRIVVGEVRGGEALDMLQAMNTGHEGGLCTVHANSARDALSRIETMVLLAGVELPSRAIREQMASAIDFVVHVQRFEDGVRRIASIAEVTGLEGDTLLMQEVFRFEQGPLRGRRLSGAFQPTGIVPRFFEGLRRRGLTPSLEGLRPAGGGGGAGRGEDGA